MLNFLIDVLTYSQITGLQLGRADKVSQSKLREKHEAHNLILSLFELNNLLDVKSTQK